ncbi:unnamed protein product [Periconia digitata]|uniref:Uncharacterized protein n=1 Tax=Periconia digitata TaxID=1303443 RepID=A0A9W4UA10_9PLEO|nr:unnamed protein product [Periconia digitata]
MYLHNLIASTFSVLQAWQHKAGKADTHIQGDKHREPIQHPFNSSRGLRRAANGDGR